MNIHTLQVGFFIILLLAVVLLFYFVIAPYIAAIFLAIVTAVLFWPINRKIQKFFGNKKGISSVFSVLFVLLIISVPLVIVGNLLVQESTNLYNETLQGETSSYSVSTLVERLESYVDRWFPNNNIDLGRFLSIERGVVWLSQNLSTFFSGIFRLTISFFIYVLCLFYLFKDGESLAKKVLSLSPLFDTHDSLILNKLTNAINSVLKGQLLVGLIQGTLTGIGFAIFGISNPVIWGSIAAIASLIPTIGTSIITAPAILYLLFTGNNLQAVGLLVWAAIAVGLVDNILGPYFIKRGVQIHPFLILISVLGGIGLFGPVGFIAGPVLLSLLFALLELYPIIMRQKLGLET